MSQPIKVVSDTGIELALIIRADFEASKHQFLTKPENPLQLGILQFERNSSVKAHYHKKIDKIIHTTQEFILLVTGCVSVNIFFKQKMIFETKLLPGDSLLQFAGGHSFTFLEESKLITIKQGPYLGSNADKAFLPTA